MQIKANIFSEKKKLVGRAAGAALVATMIAPFVAAQGPPPEPFSVNPIKDGVGS
jgi:hypothetical protein